jgi:hypothetical protein
MSLVLQSSGGGSVTIQEPTTASNFTATMPAATGTVVLTGTTPTLNGITFPATQVPSADANTLDDYEEGTWTPAIAPSGGGTITLKNITAYYTKIGRQVQVQFVAQINTASSATGRMGLTGLPFAASGPPTGCYFNVNGFSAFSGYTGGLIESSSTGNLDRYTSGSIAADMASYAASNGYIFFNGTYTA